MILDTFGGVNDFFHSSTWYVIRNLGIFFLVVFWVATVFWVYKDAETRGMNGILWGILTFLFCIIALPVYLIVRKPQTGGV